ncbi:NAD(P)-dependent malic enzyme [Sporolactobacillus pectinivorans]|uniref:NAD(P)-dependent malic enzyme n=1 Tax=Sporolactobacillus pectinivorans TaxID=1591408 RepID=UPI000C26B8EA|nr:NADP-dependent malic enzyme [Sporolactobacillus pectinivorans]
MTVGKEEILELHKKKTGLLSIHSEFHIKNKTDLGMAYTPGVADVCKEISAHEEEADIYTMKGKTLAVITDGSAVLGLGNIGPKAGLPVVEGKSLIYKELAGVNAIPLCINQVGAENIVNSIKNLAGSFGGIHLEDIKAPDCFTIEEQLKKELSIPVYHDDQHGTAIAVLAALYNAAKVVNKPFETLKVVINGAGASGIATAKLLQKAGIDQIVMVDVNGALVAGDEKLNFAQQAIAKSTNPEGKSGKLEEVIADQDVFIGLSVSHVLTKEMVEKMAKDAIIFALANPRPEILPEDAYAGGARIVATGGSNYPNQINNILVFPGLFKGLLDAKATDLTDELKIIVAQQIAEMIKDPVEEKIIPGIFDGGVVELVSKIVFESLRKQPVQKFD